MDLPVPVIGGINPLAERRRMEEEVVWRHADRPQPLHRRLQRLRKATQCCRVNVTKIGGVVVRNHPGLKCRSTRERRNNCTIRIAMDESPTTRHLVLHHVAVGAAARTNGESRRAADLFGESVRHLRKIVRLKAEVIGHRPRLRRGIADELNVRRCAVLSRGADLVADRGEELHHKHRWHFVEFAMLAAWCNQRGPRAGSINITQRHEACISRRRIGTRPY